MYRLSLIISEIYNKYLPLAEKDGIILNLDFSDTTKEISDPDRIKQFLDDHLSSTLQRSDKGEITIGVDKEAITITDSATTLSRAACALLSNKYIDVSSRVGFGTTVKIFFQPRELPTPPPTEPVKLQIEDVAINANIDNDERNTTIETSVATKAKLGKKTLGLGAKLKLKGKDKKTSKSQADAKSKPANKLKVAKSQRQLAIAAKKANKEVKRIAKKANKEAKKQAKAKQKTAKTTKQSTKSQKSTTKSPAKAPVKKTKTVRRLKLS